jgi:hypothetical protein
MQEIDQKSVKMITFLRRVRKGVFEEGRIGNYLIYALGEIVLVVIGILIALQINNWNEERKARRLENVYYCKLLEDVRQDQVLLNSLSVENEERIKGSNELISMLQKKKPRPKAVMTAMRTAIAKTTFTFKPSKSAFEDIKSSGNLHILTDLELKDKLINYYSVLEGYVDLVDVNSDAAVAMYYHVEKNFAEMGWQDLDFVRNEMDSAVVDIKALESQSYPSAETIKQLLNESIFYLYTNARKKELYQTMALQISGMEATLAAKCQ